MRLLKHKDSEKFISRSVYQNRGRYVEAEKAPMAEVYLRAFLFLKLYLLPSGPNLRGSDRSENVGSKFLFWTENRVFELFHTTSCSYHSHQFSKPDLKRKLAKCTSVVAVPCGCNLG